MHRALVLLWIGMGCGCGPDEASPLRPWEDLAAIPPDPFAEVLASGFLGAAPERLVPVPMLPSVAGLDPTSGELVVMDGRYRHARTAWCVPLYGFGLPDDGVDRVAGCGDDAVWLRRGLFSGAAPIRAVAGDPARSQLVAVDARGRWWTFGADLDAQHPADWLRGLQTGLDPTFTDPGAPGMLAVGPDGELAAAFGATGWRWPAIDEPPEDGGAAALPGVATDVVYAGDTPVFATAGGIAWGLGGAVDVLAGAPARLVADGDAVWVTVPDEDLLLRLDGPGPPAAELVVDGLRGPIARDVDGRLLLAVDDGVAVVEGGAEVARHAAEPPLDLLAQPSGEWVLLYASGAVDVRFDDHALRRRVEVGADPLRIALATFFENPKRRSERLPCADDDPDLDAYVTTALANRAWLDVVPATVMLGLTPTAVRQLTSCERVADLQTLVAVERTEPGVLFHEAPRCDDGDQGCIDDFLADDASAFDAVELAPTWTSGASAWDLVDADWVGATLATGLPARHLFFGLAALPDVTQEDPRAKEPLPWAGAAARTGWTVEAHDGGNLALYPGVPVSGYILAGCAGLLAEECGRVDAGGGAIFEAGDTAVLSLLLRRALHARSDAGPDTWYFHLPAIELYDYTEGCTRSDDGVWSGETCEAALLQSWLFDVHARFVLGGDAAWTLPSELPVP